MLTYSSCVRSNIDISWTRNQLKTDWQDILLADAFHYEIAVDSKRHQQIPSNKIIQEPSNELMHPTHDISYDIPEIPDSLNLVGDSIKDQGLIINHEKRLIGRDF